MVLIPFPISDIQTLENRLKELGAHRRRDKSSQPTADDEEGDQTRACLLELYEDVLVSEPSLAVSRGLEDKMWNMVFYTRIEELRNIVRKVGSSWFAAGAHRECIPFENSSSPYILTLLVTGEGHKPIGDGCK